MRRKVHLKIKSSRNIAVNILLVICIVSISVYYASGGRMGRVSVFLNNANDIPIYSVEISEKKIALTFDVAYGTEYIDDIIKILSDNKIKATFFIIGDWVSKYPDQIKLIDKNGHEIGNHSTTHPYCTKLDRQDIKEEIYITSSRIKSITGKKTDLFRPPYGDYNSQVVKSSIEAGHKCIQWDVDSMDWTNPGEDVIYSRVISKTGSGSIILFHNTSGQTVKVLDKIIKELKSKGYEFATVSDLIYKQDYYIDHTGRQRPAE